MRNDFVAKKQCCECHCNIDDGDEYLHMPGEGDYCYVCGHDILSDRLDLKDLIELINGGQILTWHTQSENTKDKPLPGQISLFGGFIT